MPLFRYFDGPPRVQVGRQRDGDHIERGLLFEHLVQIGVEAEFIEVVAVLADGAEIEIGLIVGELLFVDVAERDDLDVRILLEQLHIVVQMAAAHAADADERRLESFCHDRYTAFRIFLYRFSY